MIKILTISCSLQLQCVIILFNTMKKKKKKKKYCSEQTPEGMWARKGYYSITSESAINKSSPEIGRQIGAALHTKLHCSARQWLIKLPTSDNQSNQVFIKQGKKSQRREPYLSPARKHGLAIKASSWDTWWVQLLPPLLIFCCSLPLSERATGVTTSKDAFCNLMTVGLPSVHWLF